MLQFLFLTLATDMLSSEVTIDQTIPVSKLFFDVVFLMYYFIFI